MKTTKEITIERTATRILNLEMGDAIIIVH
jgi:hypothetical protein